MSQSQRKGVPAEKLGEQMLRKEGYMTQHAKFRREDYEGAEKIVGENETVLDPDMLAIANAETVWVEIKQFEQPNPCRVREQKEHGVRKRKMQSYRRVADVSGIPVWLFIFEETNGCVLAANINELSQLPPIDEEQCVSVYGEIIEFFPRQELEKLKLKREYKPNEFDYRLEYGVGQPLNDIVNGVDKTPPGYQVKFTNWTGDD